MTSTLISRMRAVAFVLLALSPAAVDQPARGENLHFTYLWHLEQPIYWPDQQGSGQDRYERAWQSIQRTDGGAAHPQNDLRSIFSLADRVAAYQYRTRDSVNSIRTKPEAGAQVSYSGGLIENIMSLGAVNQLGYSPGWYLPYREARNWTTSGGKPRMDIVQFSFHHALLPLCDDSTIRKEIQLYKSIYPAAWGNSPAISRGFFPSEMAFSERMIRVLAEEGITWCVVSNEHISRACVNFPVVLGTGGINCDPPNAADQINPAQAQYQRTTISRGCSPVNAVPYAYTPHRARYVDPQSGAVSEIIVVPADQALSWNDGYAPLGLGGFNSLQPHNPASRPMLVLLAHDGDNAWGGGYSYYMEAVPNLVNSADSAGYVATTIEQYLQNHPVPADDFVHVEDGAWVNADGDFGSPVFLNWNWPLVNSSGQIDIANGWAEDERNWAVITAAQNRVDTAEQIAGGADIADILDPGAGASAAERAWHYFLGALNSGYMYYGTSLDMEVKPTIACNEAVSHADAVIGNGSLDATPPTIWIPQRHPWNPGSQNFGPQYAYQSFQSNGDFWIWTFVYDVSGVASVTLKYRLDNNDVMTDANRVYAGSGEVGAWQNMAMTHRAFPAGNFFNSPDINFFEMPQYIADQYHAQITGIRSKLVDYYVEAVDGRGIVRRSPIQHVYVGDGQGGSGGGDRVTWTPNPAVAGQPVMIQFDPVGGPLAGASTIRAHVGFNQWQSVLPGDLNMTYNSTSARWEVSVAVPTNATKVDVAFNNGAGTWDNNNGADWHVNVTGTIVPNWVMDGQLDSGAILVAQNGAMHLHAGIAGSTLYVAGPDAGEGNDHFIFVAGAPGNLRAAPWAKAGQVADWSAFVADENSNDYEGWFDAGAGVAVAAATGANGGVLEGTIDIEAELGSYPEKVWLAFAAYANPDGGGLVAGSQVPAGNGNANIEASEYALFYLYIRGDMNFDRLITIADVPGLVEVLLGTETSPQSVRAADTNADGDINALDIQAFVDLLLP